MTNPQVRLSYVLTALKETRDGLAPGKLARATLGIIKDWNASVELYPHTGVFVEPDGTPDAHGNRFYALPIVKGDAENSTLVSLTRAWARGDYSEDFRFPPVEIIDDLDNLDEDEDEDEE